MFLKTQEDITELIRKYPLESHEIRISGGQREGSSIYIGSENTYTIENAAESIILYVDCSVPNMVQGEDNIDFRDTNTYPIEGIQVISVFKKLLHTENTLIEKYPIILDSITLSNEPEIIKLYEKAVPLSQFISRVKWSLKIIKSVRYDQKNNPDNLNLTFFYYYNIFAGAAYLGACARRILENGNDTLSIVQFLEDVVSNTILVKYLGGKIDELKAYWKFVNEEITLKELHQIETHLLGSISVQRTSNTTREFSEKTPDISAVIKKLDEMTEIITDCFNQLGIPINDFSDQIQETTTITIN